MDVLILLRLFGRHKAIVGLTILLTVGGLVATYLMAPPVFRASGSVVLLNPAPLPETDAEAPARGPAFQNPIKDLDDMSVVVDILARVMSTTEVQEKLADEGLVGTYTIGANLDFYRGPIIDVAAEAETEAEAMESASRVMTEVGTQLAKLQSEQGTDPSFQIRTATVVAPERATAVFSSALRRLIGVGALGVIAVIAAALAAEALAVSRARRRIGSELDPEQVRDDDFVAQRPPMAIEALLHPMARPRALRAGSAVEKASPPCDPPSAASEQRRAEERSPFRDLNSDPPEVKVVSGLDQDDVEVPEPPRSLTVHPYVQAVRAVQASGDPVVDDQFPSRRSS